MSAMATRKARGGTQAVLFALFGFSWDNETNDLLTEVSPSKSKNHKNPFWKGSFKGIQFLGFISEKVIFA